jgi:hypothetical protein
VDSGAGIDTPRRLRHPSQARHAGGIVSHIFLSYDNEDREFARQLVGLLEAAGWRVWWDRRIPTGKTWRAVLDKALADMGCMIVLWSTRSVESRWVIEEAEEGMSRGKLLPLLIEDVRPPRGFREVQALSFVSWDRTADAPCFRSLLQDILAATGRPTERGASTGGDVGADTRQAIRTNEGGQPQSRRLRTVLLVAGAAAVAVGLGIAFMSKDRTSATEQAAAAGARTKSEPVTESPADRSPVTHEGAAPEPDATKTPSVRTGERAAIVVDPPSNVRESPNGRIICSIAEKRTIRIFSAIDHSSGRWYETDICGGTRKGVIHQSQVELSVE